MSLLNISEGKTTLDDRECLVVQFIHEKDQPVQVAFQAWVKDFNKVGKSMDTIVNSDVVIEWPVDVDVVCAKPMERKLKNHANKWEDLVVRVLAVGEWTEMCQQLLNISKFGVCNPSKNQRRALCHKQKYLSDSDVMDDGSDLEDNYNNNNTKKTTKTSENKDSHKSKVESQVKKVEKIKTNKSTKSGKVANDLNNKLVEEIKKLPMDKFMEQLTDEEDEDEFRRHKWSRSQLIEKINILEIENRKLRKDNARLRALRCVNEDLEKITQMSSSLFSEFDKYYKNFVSLKNSHSSTTVSTNKMKSNSLNVGVVPLNKHVQSGLSKMKTISSIDVGTANNIIKQPTAQSVSNVSTNITNAPKADETCINTIKSSTVNPILGEDCLQIDPEEDTKKIPRNEQQNTDGQNMINFGGRLVERERISRLNKSKGVTSFTTSIMSVVFTKEEMATSSMTGKISNFSKNKTAQNTSKKELNPPVKDAVLEYVMREMGINSNMTAEIKVIKSAMKSKLNNECSLWRKNVNEPCSDQHGRAALTKEIKGTTSPIDDNQ